MFPALQIVAPLAKMLFNTIDRSVDDKVLAEKLKAEVQMQLMQSKTEELQAAASIVEAEAKAGWFTASWRPLLMYVLIFIIVWNYIVAPIVKVLGHGTIISFELPGDVWTLLQIGLGGYVIGRSGESMMRSYATAQMQNTQPQNNPGMIQRFFGNNASSNNSFVPKNPNQQ